MSEQSRQAANVFTIAKAGSSHLYPQAGDKEHTGIGKSLETSKPSPNDTLPPTRPHTLILSQTVPGSKFFFNMTYM